MTVHFTRSAALFLIGLVLFLSLLGAANAPSTKQFVAAPVYWALQNELTNTFYQLAAGDLNHDGKPDLVLTGGSLSVLLNNGDGTFKNTTDYTGISNSVVLGDFNNDGNLDIVTNGTCVRLGNGDGTFQGANCMAGSDY